MKFINFHNKIDKSVILNNSLKYDIVIVGTGIASYFLSLKLNKKFKILLIKKGNFDDKILDNNTIINKGKIKLKPNTVNETVGGTSNLWSGNLCEYTENEFYSNGINLWPFKSELKTLYKEAWKLLGVNFRKTLPPNYVIDKFQVRKIITQYLPTRTRNKFKYLNIDLLINANVDSVGENNHPFIVINKQKILFKKIILATGGLRTINIIQNSITNKYLDLNLNDDFVGKGYMNHPKFRLKNYVIPNNNEKIIKKYEKNNYNFFGYSLPNHIQKNNNLNNSYFRMHPNFIDENNRCFVISKFIFSNKKNLLKNLFKFNFKSKYFFELFNLLKKYNFNFLSILTNYNFYYYLLFFFGVLSLKVKSYDIEFFLELSRNKLNTINFQNNKIITNINLSKKEIDTIKYLNSMIYNTFSKNHTVSLEYKNISFDKLIINDASHHIGGLVLKNFNNNGFIDKNFKVLNTKNIYISGSSIFPTSGSCNPTLTIVALVIKLTKHLIK